MSRLVNLFLVVAITFPGCGKRVPLTDTFQGRGLKIAKVSVQQSPLEPERQEVYDKLDTAKQIELLTIEHLKKRELYDPQGRIVLSILIDDFRLRHGATRFFTGIYSGSDHIIATVRAVEDNKCLISKKVEAAGGNGNPFNFSRNSRGHSLFDAVAKLSIIPLQREKLDVPVECFPGASVTSAPVPPTAPPVPARPEPAKRAGKCSVDQILTMKGTNLSDEQIRAACD